MPRVRTREKQMTAPNIPTRALSRGKGQKTGTGLPFGPAAGLWLGCFEGAA